MLDERRLDCSQPSSQDSVGKVSNREPASEPARGYVVAAATAAVIIALLAGLATDLAAVVPPSLPTAGVGLAVVGVLSNAMQEVTRGPLLLGPMFAFGIALSEMSLLGLGPFFWALVVGLVVSRLHERNKAREGNGSSR